MKSLIARLGKDPREIILTVIIALLGVLVLVLLASFVTRQLVRPPVEASKTADGKGPVIQIDILNGSGIDGAATTCASYLRARGYDVVEMRNYRRSDVDRTLVIDRTGNVENAEKVAYALGVRKENVIRQINEDYYVDVSVLVGKDFPSLKPSQ